MTIDTVDELVKLLIGLSLTFAISGISFQLMRLISKTVDSIQDLRGAFKNISNISDLVLDDYVSIRSKINDILDKFIHANLLSAVFFAFNSVKDLKNKFRKKSDITSSESLKE